MLNQTNNQQTLNYINTINSIQNSWPINILYDNNYNSLFYKCLKYLSWSNLIGSDVLNNFPIPYAIKIHTDPIEFSRKNSLINIYDNLFLFHHQSYNFLKKEDISILNTNLNRYHKISFSASTVPWNLSNIYHLRYGIPKIDYEHRKNKKSVVILNFHNNQQSNVLYSILRNNFSDAGMLTNINMSLKNIYENISEYKVCVDLDSYFNLLIGCAAGAYGVTNVSSQDSRFIFSISDASSSINLIQSLLQAKSEDHDSIISYIDNQYNFDHFDNLLKIYVYKNILGDDHE